MNNTSVVLSAPVGAGGWPCGAHQHEAGRRRGCLRCLVPRRAIRGSPAHGAAMAASICSPAIAAARRRRHGGYDLGVGKGVVQPCAALCLGHVDEP